MKKIKLLTPFLSVVALGATIAPIATSCSNVQEETNIIPTDLLDITGYTLKGLRENADVSKYNTLVIPEGIKIIEDNAFEDEFATGSVHNSIRTVVIPNTVREIRKSAFKGCDALRVLDFSSWTVDDVHYLKTIETTGEESFANTSKIGAVITNPSLSDESKDKLESLLTGAKLNACWFAPISSDKVKADEAWKVQKKLDGKDANYIFECNVDIKQGTSVYAQVTRTAGTKNVDVECGDVVLKENNIMELPISLVNAENTDDYCEFDVTFVAIKDATGVVAEPLWQETLTGFKLINIKSLPEPEIDSITINDLSQIKTAYNEGDRLTLDGLVVMGHYNDPTLDPVRLNDYTVTPAIGTILHNSQTVTISYPNCTSVTIPVTVDKTHYAYEFVADDQRGGTITLDESMAKTIEAGTHDFTIKGHVSKQLVPGTTKSHITIQDKNEVKIFDQDIEIQAVTSDFVLTLYNLIVESTHVGPLTLKISFWE